MKNSTIEIIKTIEASADRMVESNAAIARALDELATAVASIAGSFASIADAFNDNKEREREREKNKGDNS